MTACPCSSGRDFDACCGPYLSGDALPPTAEALMRSRYSAFATGNIDYLEETLAPEERHDLDRSHITDWSQNSTWTGLEIRTTEAGGEGDATGVVEFLAKFERDGKPQVHHETSRFLKRDGRWYYVDGNMGPPPRKAAKVGRNDPCPCGSGKKYKKCCGAAA